VRIRLGLIAQQESAKINKMLNNSQGSNVFWFHMNDLKLSRQAHFAGLLC
jgi:hypothetical protein